MKKINKFENPSFESGLAKNNNFEKSNQVNDEDTKHEKVLCNHCGRTAKNGIRCLGICVADNDY